MDFEQFITAAELNTQDLVEYYGGEDHPEVVRRKGIDQNVAKGMSPSLAHECGCGTVDLSQPDSKARLAATLARLSKSKGSKAPEADKNSKSLYAQDKEETEAKNGKQ